MLAIQEGTQIMDMGYDMFDDLGDEARELINGCIANEDLRKELTSIRNYQSSKLEDKINKEFVKGLQQLGITIFGKTVRKAKVYILDFVEQHPELMDEDPEKCLMKIIYYFAYCYHNNKPL